MLTNQLRNSGPDRVMLDIGSKIDRNKVKPVVIALMQDDPIRPIASEFEKADIEIHRFDYSKLQLELKSRRIRLELERYIQSHFKNPIVQAHGYHPTILTSKMMIPHTATIHCIASEDFIKSKGRILGSYMVWRFKHNLKRHNYPIAISKYMLEYYASVCDVRLRLIHNGVNFQPKLCDIDKLKRNLNLPLEKKIIVVPGGISKRKNNLHTIEQLIKSGLNNYVCVFLGIGPQLEQLQTYFGKDHRFRFEGYKSNVGEYLACADLYISSSLSEGLPLAALEAVCMGVPSLLSDIPPHSEIVEIMKYEGVKQFSLQSDMLSELVKIFLISTFNRKGISDRAIQYFSSETMAGKYELLLEDIKNKM